MDKDTRVILSLTLHDLREMRNGFCEDDSTEARIWHERVVRIHDHLVDSVDIHFTSLG